METLIPLSIIGIPVFSVILCINIIKLLKIIIHNPEQSTGKYTILISISLAYILFAFLCILIVIADSAWG